MRSSFRSLFRDMCFRMSSSVCPFPTHTRAQREKLANICNHIITASEYTNTCPQGARAACAVPQLDADPLAEGVSQYALVFALCSGICVFECHRFQRSLSSSVFVSVSDSHAFSERKTCKHLHSYNHCF